MDQSEGCWERLQKDRKGTVIIKRKNGVNQLHNQWVLLLPLTTFISMVMSLVARTVGKLCLRAEKCLYR